MPQSEKEIRTLSSYRFEFKDQMKKINLLDNLSIEAQEQKIKKSFNIDPDKQINFLFINIDDEEERIKDMKQQMKTFKNGTIRINLCYKTRSRSR